MGLFWRLYISLVGVVILAFMALFTTFSHFNEGAVTVANIYCALLIALVCAGGSFWLVVKYAITDRLVLLKQDLIRLSGKEI